MRLAWLSPLLLRAGLRYQLHHRWQALLALSGIVMGVAVVLAVDLANAAAKASFALSAQQLRGAATHRLVGSDGRVPQALYSALATRPGHPPLAPVISARVQVEGRPGSLRLLGLDLFAEAAFRDALPGAIQDQAALAAWLARTDALALGRAAADALGLDVGDRLQVLHAGRARTLEVFAVHPDEGLAARDLLLVDIATAQSIAGLDAHISHIDLILDPAAERWLAPMIPPGVRLVSIDAQVEGVAGLSSAFELNLTAMSLLALLVGLFLIFNAISFSVVQRRRLLGRLRAMGVSAGEIQRLVLVEALVLGAVGTLLGSALGLWLGQGLTRIVAATVSELYYQVAGDAMQLSWASLLKASALGLGATLLAAWLPARQAARTPALTALSRAALEQSTRAMLPRLALVGALMVAAGLLLAFVLPGGVVASFAGLFVALLGAALLTPLVLRAAHALLRPGLVGTLWAMAGRDLDRHLSRLATATAALVVALAASVGVGVMVDSMRLAVGDWLDDLLAGDLYIAAQGFEQGAVLPDGIAALARQLPGVSAASLYRDVRLQLDSAPVVLVAAELAPASRAGFELLERVAADPWQRFDQGAVLISEPLSRRLGLHAGDVLQLPTPLGPGDFEVAAVFRDYASEHGRIFMPLAPYRETWADTDIDTLALFSTTGDPEALLDAAIARLSGEHALVFTAARAIHDESMAVFDRTFRITEVLRLLSLGVAFVGIFSALMALQLDRRKEFAVLRALGLTRSRVATLIATESAMLGFLAGLLAIPVGLVLAWVLTDAIQPRAFGWSMPLRAAQADLLSSPLLGTAAALLASLYPAWRAGWQDPAPQLRED